MQFVVVHHLFSPTLPKFTQQQKIYVKISQKSYKKIKFKNIKKYLS